MNTKKQINNYVARQKAWVKANNVQPGDNVLILRNHPSYEKGWNNSWPPPMDINIGRVIRVIRVFKEGIMLDTSIDFIYPYTVLIKVPKGIYITESFMFKDKEHKCIVHTSLTTNENGTFGFQSDLGNGKPGLRKYIDAFSIDDGIHDVFNTKGYYPYEFLQFGERLKHPLVVASTLEGIGLPILRYPK